MVSIYDILAEQRIADALRRGEFDHLPGAGKPLKFEEALFVSAEQRMANTVLHNSGFSPPEIALRKEVARLRAEITGLEEGELRSELCRRMAMLILHMGVMHQGW